MIMKYLTVIILLFALVSCKATSSATDANKQTVLFLKLGEAVDAGSKAKNIAGYKIDKKIKISLTQQTDLLEELNNPANFEKAVRRCAFEPTYAVLVNNQLYALFDIEFCPKIQLSPQNDGKIQDLKQNNTLKELIIRITKK